MSLTLFPPWTRVTPDSMGIEIAWGEFQWTCSTVLYMLASVTFCAFLASGILHTSNSLLSKPELWTAIVMFPNKFMPDLNMLFPFLMWDCLPICCFWFGFFKLCLQCWENIFMESLSINTSFSIYFIMCFPLTPATLAAPPNSAFSLQ